MSHRPKKNIFFYSHVMSYIIENEHCLCYYCAKGTIPHHHNAPFNMLFSLVQMVNGCKISHSHSGPLQFSSSTKKKLEANERNEIRRKKSKGGLRRGEKILITLGTEFFYGSERLHRSRRRNGIEKKKFYEFKIIL